MIKYHDNISGHQYGADHTLTDNWNASADFPKDSYIRVYFRLDCPAYDFRMSFDNAESREAFYTEVRDILKCFDIFEGTGGRYDGFPMEHLHIHPQVISGVVAKWKVRYIAEALNDCETCKIRWVDVYQDISTMSNEEFAESLESKAILPPIFWKCSRPSVAICTLFQAMALLTGSLINTMFPAVRPKATAKIQLAITLLLPCLRSLSTAEILSAQRRETASGTGQRKKERRKQHDYFSANLDRLGHLV